MAKFSGHTFSHVQTNQLVVVEFCFVFFLFMQITKIIWELP